MANQKVYQIQINGLTESISAVDALNKQLDQLDKRISALQGKAVNIGAKTSGGGSKSSSTHLLSEEEALQKEINNLKNEGTKLDAKIIAAQEEIYKKVQATKDIYKETVEEQKALSAAERLQANTYSNTMAGMKQHLADIKAVINTTDIGDGDQIKKMTDEANELTKKLKEMEEAYGQFGRNVGNYSSAFDGMQKLSITIGGVTREFNSAREASRTLKNELVGLEAAGQGNTEVAKELRSEYYKLQSAIDDATKSSKAMDSAMDMMKSFTAMASVGGGLKAFFGFDNNEIQKSIQSLVALQNVLNGIETLRKQMETGEGFGKVFSKSFDKIDEITNKTLVLNRALNGTGTSAKVAAFGINALSTAAKALASIGIVAVVSALAYAMQKAFEAVRDWIKGNADLVTSEQRLKIALDATNESLERNLKLNKAKYDAGQINSVQLQTANEEAYAAAIRATNIELEKRAKINPNNSTFANAMNNTGGKGWDDFLQNDKGVTTLGGFSEASKTIEELTRRYEELSKAAEKNTGLVYKNAKGIEIAHLTASDVRDELNHLEQFMGGQLIGRMREFDTTTEEGRKALQNFVNGIMENDNDLRKSILLNLPSIVDNEKGALGDGLNNLLTLIKQFVANSNAAMNALDFEKYVNSILDAADDTGKRMAQKQKDELTARYNSLSAEEQKKQKENYDKAIAAIDKLEAKKRQKVSNSYKKLEKETRDAENDLANLRVANMKEGLNKVLKQLEEERKQRLAKVEADGRLVGERQAEINKLYDKKILDAKREWAENVRKTYKNMWDNIYSYSLETQNKIVENTRQAFENQSQLLEYGRSRTFGNKQKESDDISSYGIQGTNQLSKGTQIELQVQEQNTKKLGETYDARLEIIEAYWKERTELTLKSENELREQEKEQENQSFRREMTALNDHYNELEEEVKKGLSADTLVEEDAEKIRERNRTEFQKRQETLVKEHNNNLLQIQQNSLNKMQGLTAEYYRERLQELRDFQTAISSLESKQPVYNSWGIINLAETKKNNENLLESYRTLSNEIVGLKRKLQTQLDNNEISFDDFQQANRELDSFADNVGQKMDKVKRELTLGEQIGSFIQSINTYVQTGLQAVQTVMNAIADYQDYQFDKEQEALDKELEMIQEKLDEYENIVEEHKNNIDSIEDELASSRGDRRQYLIDQLNNEVEAQRRAEAEKQRLQKEEEANKKKQEKLDKKRKQAEYKRNLLSIIVSTAMATANGLATQPFVPVGIIMGSLATALGMAQYALAAAAKPYAKGGQLDGGVAVGNRHRDGGIKVLGGRAEIEGGEFITNRISTQMNAPLLEFINSKKKKIDASDLLEFYSSGSVKRNIAKVKTKFEDGGYVPTLPNSIDVRDQLQNIIINQDNRPIYVSVVDINNKQEQVRQVQALAGLSD